MTKHITFLFIAGFILSLTACLDTECIEKTETYVKVSFCSYDDKKTALPDSLTLYGIGSDVKIYDNQKKITLPALIPLKYSDNETEFIIEINGTTDTIQFLHSNFLYLISKECGYSMYHKIDTIYFTTNAIDSIAIINKDITLKNTDNVAIFY